MFFANLTKLLKNTSVKVFSKSLASNPAVEKIFRDRVMRGACCVRCKSTHSLTCLLWKFFLSKFMLSLFVEINLPLKAELNYFPCQHAEMIVEDLGSWNWFPIFEDLRYREKVDKLPPNLPEYSTSFYIISLRLEWNEIKVKQCSIARSPEDVISRSHRLTIIFFKRKPQLSNNW